MRTFISLVWFSSIAAFVTALIAATVFMTGWFLGMFVHGFRVAAGV